MNSNPPHGIMLPALLALGGLLSHPFLNAADHAHPADSWVATDALGRSLPGHRETGDRKAGKFVGVFYFVWVGNHTPKVHDITKILQADGPNPKWGPPGATHLWGEPEQGYFHASDPWVIRRDLQMLVNADVDFLYLDTTNTLIYEETVDQLLKTIREMRAKGIPAPDVVFMTNAASGKTTNRIQLCEVDPRQMGRLRAVGDRLPGQVTRAQRAQHPLPA